ncbi:hypothetical protein [Oceanobacillus senegalensis]|uniref:hypothetical protein n=1 Tax=Oceanobacillus senegalensis TaxID=1936063 RepID=UPI000A3061DB|nr:hypothetical protein [Oceanobacillus senegalensis]
MKNYFIFHVILLCCILLISGCDNSKDKVATISAHSDSEYVQTFEDLHLGILFDFDFKLLHADKHWVDLWMERYQNGIKESQPLTQLSYGNSPNHGNEGQLGFGVINPISEDTFVFLYGPDVRTEPSRIEKETKDDMLTSWDYAIGDEEVELALGETKILAVYRETEGNSIRTVDYQDKESLNNMIKQDDMVWLLKIRIEETNANHNEGMQQKS